MVAGDKSSQGAVHIDVPLVVNLVATQFPEYSHLPITPVSVSGWDNRTFHLGSEMLVRLPSGEYYARAVDKEQTWLPRLKPKLPLAIPEPLGRGQPDETYPWPWSIYKWLDGDVASRDNIADLDKFANDLALFLIALQTIDISGGPIRKLRGGSLAQYEPQVEAALDALSSQIDTKTAADIWCMAIDAPIASSPVWYHGDVAAGNLLVVDGQLSAVIDFGGLGVGDPACDMAIAWTLFDASSRQVFRERLGVNDAIWNRGRGWALWKGLIVMAKVIETNAIEAASSQYAIDQIIEDYLANG